MRFPPFFFSLPLLPFPCDKCSLQEKPWTQPKFALGTAPLHLDVALGRCPYESLWDSGRQTVTGERWEPAPASLRPTGLSGRHVQG